MNDITQFLRALESISRRAVDIAVQAIRTWAVQQGLEEDTVIRAILRTEKLRGSPLVLLGKLLLWRGDLPPMQGASRALSRVEIKSLEAIWERACTNQRLDLVAAVADLNRANPDIPAKEVLAEMSEYLANERRHIRHPYLLALMHRVIGV